MHKFLNAINSNKTYISYYLHVKQNRDLPVNTLIDNFEDLTIHTKQQIFLTLAETIQRLKHYESAEGVVSIKSISRCNAQYKYRAINSSYDRSYIVFIV